MTKHDFTIVIKPYNRKNCYFDDMRQIYCSKSCIVAKNEKHGGLYLNPKAKIIKGKFRKVAGSNSSPILMAQTEEVHIRVINFPKSPKITTDQRRPQAIITIIDHTTTKT